MTLPYLGRLLCLALGAFFLIHTAASFGVWLLASRVVRYSVSFEPKAAARFMFCLRLFPVAISAVLVLALFAPSYVMFEPEASTESIGFLCLLTAGLGTALLASGLLRGGFAVFRSARYLRQQEESGAPMILVAGLLRPRLVVSSSIRDSLTTEELDAALRHEEAHARAKDNLKRLFILMCPSMLAFHRGFQTLEAGWQRLTEWAADDSATEGSTSDALALASALIRVGRMNAGAPCIPLGTSLLADLTDLRTRVERLIDGPPNYRQLPGKSVLVFGTVVLVTMIALSPTLLPASHQLLEKLAH